MTAAKNNAEAPPASFTEITRLLAALPPLLPRPPLAADSRIDVALYAGPHAGIITDWAALRVPWEIGTAPAARLFAAQPALDLHLFEMGKAPIADSTQGPALTERQAAHAMAYGMMAARQDLGLLILSTVGDDQTGADASALAVVAALLKRDPVDLSDDVPIVAHAAAALAANRARLTDPLTILATLGGHESCALLGAIIAARLGNIPVWLEGWPALAAALVLVKLAGNTAAARDLLGHACATRLPTVLQPVLASVLDSVSADPACGVAFGDAQQAASVLSRLHSAPAA